MNEFFVAMYKDLVIGWPEMFMDWPLGTTIAVLMAVVALFVLGFVAQGIFIAVDSWFLPLKCGQGVVSEKEYTEAYSYMTLVGNVPMPQYCPEDFSLVVQMPSEGRVGSMSVRKDFFNRISKGAQVMAGYKKGRITGAIYLKKLRII